MTFAFENSLIIQNQPPEFVCSNRDYMRGQKSLMRNLPRFRRWCKSTVQLLDIKVESQVLEVGCGLGFALREFAKINARCVGIEISRSRARTAKLVASYFGLDLEIVIGDACYLPFKDFSFEAVFSNEVISHVTDIRVALDQQQRVLKIGKKFLIRDANFLCPTILFDLLVRYPIRTKGKRGGLKWLVNRNKNINNYGGKGITQKDENIQTLHWWKKTMRKRAGISLKVVTTSITLKYSFSRAKLFVKMLKPFLGQIIILAERTS